MPDDHEMRRECAENFAVLKTTSLSTDEKVSEMHDLLVKNGFISMVREGIEARKWMWRILATIAAGMATLFGFHLTGT